MKKMKPYSKRNQELPAPIPEQRGPVAERNGHHGYNDWNGYTSSAPYVPTVQVPVASPLTGLAPQAAYFQVLFQQVKKRWKMLFVWLLLSAAVAAVVIVKFGQPMWKAEGQLIYSPNFSGGPNPVYRPPNIQTILAMVKSPEVIEKAAKDAEINASPDSLQSKLTVAVFKQSDLISVAFEWPNKDQSLAFTAAVMNQAIEQYEKRRHTMSVIALQNLAEDLEKSKEELASKKNKMSESLAKKRIFDFKVAKGSAVSNIEDLKNEIKRKQRDQERLKEEIAGLDKKIAEESQHKDGRLTDAESERLNKMNALNTERHQLLNEIEKNQFELKSNQQTFKSWEPLIYSHNIALQEVRDMEAKINTAKRVIANGTKHLKEIDEALKRLEDNRVAPTQLLQLEMEKFQRKLTFDSLPGQIESLQKYLNERTADLLFLTSEEDKVQRIQIEIEDLQSKHTNIVTQQAQNEKLEEGKIKELTVHSPAAGGSAPTSSNHMKLAAAVLGLSMLLFLGFVAMYDMPRAMPTVGPMPYQQQPSLPGAQLPMPVWQNQMQPPQPQGPSRAASMNNEHLRALSERIMESVSERASIVLFTPTSGGLRIENLLGDLGCFLNRDGNRVLVFEARDDKENPPYPAWTGPSAREVTEQLEIYLEGQHERSSLCFAETLISGIDYARADLGRHLAGVMPMYRFRRLMQEMKERYSVVLMITPERYQGGEDDVFTTLGEGIVVVINQDADPQDVESYLRDLRTSETPVYGAVTLPPGRSF